MSYNKIFLKGQTRNDLFQEICGGVFGLVVNMQVVTSTSHNGIRGLNSSSTPNLSFLLHTLGDSDGGSIGWVSITHMGNSD